VKTRLGLLAAVVLGSAFGATSATSSGSAVSIVVSPSAALLDRRVDVRVSGLRPGQRIALEAATRDVLGRRWRSRLVFRASRAGVVDTHAGMKLFWAMEPVRKSIPPAVFIPSVGPAQVVIRAVARGHTIAAGVLVRRAQTANVSRTDLTVAKQGIAGAYFAPPAGPRGPAVLQLGGSGGSYGYLPAALIASRGYPTLSLAYFKEPGLPRTLKDIPLEYFAKALRWLAAQPGVDPNRVLVYGASRGGEAALLIGATYPDLVHGVIACTPSADVFPAYPGPGYAWTLGGQPISYAEPIPVWRIAGPVLAFGGGKDLIWRSGFFVTEIVQRAREHGRPDIVGRIYPKAGHGVGFAIPNVPISGRVIKVGSVYLGIGGTLGANARAWASSWPLVLRFIRTMPY
jgi:dienelactone hydrolase